MDEYIEGLKNTIELARKRLGNIHLSEEEQVKTSTLAVATIHALAACEQAKALQSIAETTSKMYRIMHANIAAEATGELNVPDF